MSPHIHCLAEIFKVCRQCPSWVRIVQSAPFAEWFRKQPRRVRALADSAYAKNPLDSFTRIHAKLARRVDPDAVVFIVAVLLFIAVW